MSVSRTAIVVGGGIAGLAAAVALLREGWGVTVLERSAELGEVGAGLGLTANGLAALDALGVGEAARAASHRVHLAGTTDHRGRWLLRVPREEDPASPRAMRGVHRQELHRVLLEAAAGARLVAGARVTGIDPGAGGAPAAVTCSTPEGERTHEADLVVGADGVRSAVRGALFPDAGLRYSGRSSWRGIVDDADLVSDAFTIVWGPGAEFGALRVSPGQVYWYGYTALPEGTRLPDEKAAALARFDDWADLVRPLVEATPASRLVRHDVHVVAPLVSCVRGRAVLVGDAAHAMVPTMGQGANTSLEDGACVGLLVARAVDAGAPMGAALAGFDAARRPRTQAIARRSEQAGRFGADVEGRFAVALRNTALRLVPGGAAARAGSGVLAWRAPAG